MRSESTSAFGQPSETKEMRGARFMSGSSLVDSVGAIRDPSKSPAGFYSRNAA
jgi:hypothetical protein